MYSLTLFGVRSKQIVELVNRIYPFPEDKNSNRKKALICKFHKKMLKVICEKTKLIHKLQFRDFWQCQQ